MPRKTSKTTQSEKKFSAIPPKAAVASKPATPVTAAVATAPVAEALKPVATATAVAIEPIIVALHDLDADIAREAATSLGLLGDVKAVEPLLEVLNNSNGYFHSVVRCAAATSLAQLKDRRAVEPLLNAVHDPIAEASCEAIRALATLADPRAVAALVEVVRNSNGYFVNSVRRAAVLGLAKLGGETAIAELTRVSADHAEDHVIREEATAAIPAK
jgi:HEAT repeat protein